MRRVEVQGNHCSFQIKSIGTMSNAVRRALMNDVTNWAPRAVVIRKNTSCQTDEYIAHRIGLIPFGATGDTNASLHLCVENRTAYAHDFVGEGFAPCVNVPIMKLTQGQSIDLEVQFARGKGSDHAKFSHITNVTFNSEGPLTGLSFSTFGAEPPDDYLVRAIESLQQRIDEAILWVEAHYDSTKTACLE